MMVGAVRVLYIQWKHNRNQMGKDSRSSATRFIGKDDKEINLNPERHGFTCFI